MLPRSEVEEELKEIAERHSLTVYSEKVSTPSFAGWFGYPRFLWCIKVVVMVFGDDEGRVSMCLSEIFERYGRLDEAPSAFSSSKRRGRKIIKLVLSEI